jgi:hypothetical protein
LASDHFLSNKLFIFNILFFLSSGFYRVGIMSKNTVVGTMMIVLGCLWSFTSCAAIILTIKVKHIAHCVNRSYLLACILFSLLFWLRREQLIWCFHWFRFIDCIERQAQVLNKLKKNSKQLLKTSKSLSAVNEHTVFHLHR